MEKPHVPKTLSDLDAHLGYWLRFVSNHVSDAFRRRVEAEGVQVVDWVVLRVLARQPQGTGADALIAATGMTKGAVSKIVARLEERGLLRRKVDDTDARRQWLILTAAGHRLVPRLAALADENDAQYFDVLTPRERAALKATLRKLVDAHGLQAVPTE